MRHRVSSETTCAHTHRPIKTCFHFVLRFKKKQAIFGCDSITIHDFHTHLICAENQVTRYKRALTNKQTENEREHVDKKKQNVNGRNDNENYMILIQR